MSDIQVLAICLASWAIIATLVAGAIAAGVIESLKQLADRNCDCGGDSNGDGDDDDPPEVVDPPPQLPEVGSPPENRLPTSWGPMCN